MMRPFLALALFWLTSTILTGCASGQSLQEYKAKKAELLAKDNVITGTTKNKLGKETEFIMAQEMAFSLNVARTRSHNAHSCEAFARGLPPKAEGLEVCRKALAETGLSKQNRQASLFNQALILSNLKRGPESQALLGQLIAAYPKMAEPHFELARQSYNHDDYEATVIHAKAALSRGLSRPARAYNLIGMAHEYHLEFTQARAAYETALRRNPAAGDTRRRLERLNRLWPAQN